MVTALRFSRTNVSRPMGAERTGREDGSRSATGTLRTRRGQVAVMNQSGRGRPLRLTLITQSSGPLDGAWWPYTVSVARELPPLVDALRSVLGDIGGITVNWSRHESQPDLNWYGTPGKQWLITVAGRPRRVTLLLIPASTTPALAIMALRLAAGLPIDPIHRDTEAFQNAFCVVQAAHTSLRENPSNPKLSQ
jgi:hypothetical protein